MFDKSRRDDGTFSRADFQWHEDRNVYVCPAGKTLKSSGRLNSDNTYRYLASTYDCGPCPFKQRCCPKTPQRKIPRDINEDARDVARALYDTPAFNQSRRDRKKVEMLFAHLKRILKLGRLRLRGPRGAQDEFLLAATARTSEGSPNSDRYRRRPSNQHDRNSANPPITSIHAIPQRAIARRRDRKRPLLIRADTGGATPAD